MQSFEGPTLNDDIKELNQAIQQLQLAQQRVEAVRTRLQHRARAHITIVIITRRPPVFPNTNLRIGDTVRILNPRTWQQHQGTIIGTSGIYVEVRTRNRSVVRRIPRNLELISRGDENPQNPEQ